MQFLPRFHSSVAIFVFFPLFLPLNVQTKTSVIPESGVRLFVFIYLFSYNLTNVALFEEISVFFHFSKRQKSSHFPAFEKWKLRCCALDLTVLNISCLRSSEYAMSLAEGVRPSPKKGVLDMIPNCTWWWGSNSGNLGNEEYPFIAITLRSTLILTGSTC